MASRAGNSYNYKFIGWSDEANKAYTSDEKITEVTLADFGDATELTVYAKWKAKLLVTYSSGLNNGGDQSTQFVVDVYDVNGYIVKANNELNPPFHLDGYEILTWQVTEGSDPIEVLEAAPASGSGTGSAEPRISASHPAVNWLNPGDKVRFHGNITLTAQWTEIPKVKLTYHANEGTPESAVPNGGNPIEYAKGDEVTVQDGSGLTKSTLVFAYWSTSPDDVNGSRHYSKGDRFTIEQDTDLYAIWTDSDGKMIPSPGTGESNMLIALAVNMALLAVLAAGFVLMRQHIRRRKTAD